MPKEFLDLQGLQTLVSELETNIVAEEYSSSATYAIGDYCIYNNLLYRCTTTTTGTWDSTAWVKVFISDELSQSSGASSVAQLEDVQLNNLSDNDLLVYDSNLTGGKLWKNAKKIVTCTKAQFDDWSANNTFPYTDCKYIVTDVNNLNTTAADIPYDSTSTDSVKDVLDLLLNRIYPVGSIYMSVTDSTVASVEARFGGTWERISEGKALFGYSTTDTDFQTIESGGGNKVVDLQHNHTVNSHSHTIDNQSGNTGASSGNTGDCTLTINQIPSHNHDLTSYFFDGAPSAGTYGLYGSGSYKFYLKNTTTGYKGGTQPHYHSLNNHKHSIPKNTDSSSPSTDNKLSTTQNIMNPYITVYMYKRTA